MIRILLLTTTLAIARPAFAQDHAHHGHHDNHSHVYHDHNHNDAEQEASVETESAVSLYRTAEIDAALADGGSPVVVEVLGAVCDFCATAMNKTFGRHEGVKATYVDLDAKTLSLVLSSDDALTDEEIDKLVTNSGYKAKAVHRANHISGI
ncbi:MAG: cation transporter [Pseudomonadota bacterium]